MTDGWMQRMIDALAAGGCSTQKDWIAKFPGVHCWFLFDTDPNRPWQSCTCCGVVRKRDDSNKPCRGIVTIGLRA